MSDDGSKASDASRATNGRARSLSIQAHGPRPGISGRRFVLVSLGTIAVVALGLFAIFRQWTADTERRIETARAILRPALEPMADLRPPGVAGADWRDAMNASRGLLDEIAGTGRLDAEMARALRADLDAQVGQATDQNAVATLSAVWDDLEERKGRLRTSIAKTRPPLLNSSNRFPDSAPSDRAP